MVKIILKSWIVLTLLSSSSLYAQRIYTLEEWPFESFHSSTFFSMIWNTQDPESIYVAASEGALDSDGNPIDEDDLIKRYGGHWQMSNLLGNNKRERANWRGGGIRLGENREFSIFHRSRGLNGKEYDDGGLEPRLIPIIEEVLNKRLPEILAKKKSSDCADLLGAILN